MPSSSFGRYGVIGFEFAGAIGAGFFLGRAVDAHFQTGGTALWIGFFLGVLAGFMLLVQAARGLEKESAAGDAEEDAANAASRFEEKLKGVERDIADHEASTTKDESE